MPRLLVFGDAGAHTGFAKVTHSICERLVSDHGWDVHVLATNYRGDHVDTNLKLYVPTLIHREDIHGKSRFVELLGSLRPDALMFINDPSAVTELLLNNAFDPQRILFRGVFNDNEWYRPPIVAYMPIDGYESPKTWDSILPRVRRVAMTHFGQEAMPEAPVIWHGVDTEMYRPRDKAETKAALGLDPDRFLIVRIDKNSVRKDFPSTWKALRPLLRKYPDIDVIFHCERTSMMGYNMNAVMSGDPDIRDRVRFSGKIDSFHGWPEERLAMLIAAADLRVSTSWGEGFGLGELEAIASGTPVVAQDCSATTEVVGPGGVLIPPKGRITMPAGQEQCLPDVERFTAAIEHLYMAGGVRRKLGRAGVAHAQQFSWDIAAANMEAILREEIAKGVSGAISDEQRPPVGDQAEVRDVLVSVP